MKWITCCGKDVHPLTNQVSLKKLIKLWKRKRTTVKRSSIHKEEKLMKKYGCYEGTSHWPLKRVRQNQKRKLESGISPADPDYLQGELGLIDGYVKPHQF